MPVIRLSGKQIGFALPESHAAMEQIFIEIKKLLAEGAEIFPLLLINNGTERERHELKEELQKITGKDLITTSLEEDCDYDTAPGVFDLLVVAPCPGNILSKILNAITNPSIMVKTLTHLQTARPIVIALHANGDSGDLVAHIEQLLALKTVYLVPFGTTRPESKQVIITRMDLISETVLHAFMNKQIQPVVLEHHWLPS